MSIREATVDDVPDMDIINRLILSENYPQPFWEKIIKIPNSFNYVIVLENGTIVAYILSVIEHNKNRKKLTGHVYSIGVMPSHTKKGYGTMLLEAIEKGICSSEWISNVDRIILHVRKTNKGAISFYHKNDYSRIKKVKKYYTGDNGSSVDGLLMEKKL